MTGVFKYQIRIIDLKTGKVEYDRPGHSFVAQLNNAMMATRSIAPPANLMTDIASATFTPYTSTTAGHDWWWTMYSNDGAFGPPGNYIGIVLGTGVGAGSINNVAMSSRIDHGVTAGKLMYGADTCSEPQWALKTVTMKFVRLFTNGSPGAIGVNEVGIQCVWYSGFLAQTKYWLLLRDILGATVTWNIGDIKAVEVVVSVIDHYTSNFMIALHWQLMDVAVSALAQVRDTAGALHTLGTAHVRGNNDLKYGEVVAGAGVMHGIIVGTGVTDNAAADYKIETIIVHGNGVGQLAYSAMTFAAPVVLGSVSSYGLSRLLTNNSGGDITITEVALYASYIFAGTTYVLCIGHKKLAVPVTITAGTAKTVTWAESVDFTV